MRETNYADQFLGSVIDYLEYPHPDLAKLQDEAKYKPAICVACNPRERYAIPALCREHGVEWAQNRRRFEKKYYNGMDDK